MKIKFALKIDTTYCYRSQDFLLLFYGMWKSYITYKWIKNLNLKLIDFIKYFFLYTDDIQGKIVSKLLLKKVGLGQKVYSKNEYIFGRHAKIFIAP